MSHASFKPLGTVPFPIIPSPATWITPHTRTTSSERTTTTRLTARTKSTQPTEPHASRLHGLQPLPATRSLPTTDYTPLLARTIYDTDWPTKGLKLHSAQVYEEHRPRAALVRPKTLAVTRRYVPIAADHARSPYIMHGPYWPVHVSS